MNTQYYLKIFCLNFIANLTLYYIVLNPKTDGSESRKRENYWIKILKTMTPYGLNIKDSV